MRIANYRRSARARGRCARIAFRDLAAIQPPRFKGTDPSTTLVSDATNPEQGRMGTGEGVLSICISPLERYLSGSVSISSFSSWKTCKTQVPIWLYRWTIHVPFPSWSEIPLEIYIYIYIYLDRFENDDSKLKLVEPREFRYLAVWKKFQSSSRFVDYVRRDTRAISRDFQDFHDDRNSKMWHWGDFPFAGRWNEADDRRWSRERVIPRYLVLEG